MGIYSRDYIREVRPTRGHDGDLWAIKFLLIANIAVWVAQNIAPNLTVWLDLKRDFITHDFQIWRFITYGFCHDLRNIWHLAFNMYALWMFGRSLEPIYGSREFLAFYLVGILISGFAHVAIAPNPVVGASGGVMAVVFLTAMHFPRMTVLLMFVIPIELRWLAAFIAVADVMGVFNPGSMTAHMAHLGGAAFGFLYYRQNWRIMPLFDRLGFGSLGKMAKRRPKVRVYQPPEDNMDEQVDAILSKISEKGEASLTAREREILRDASRKYRERN